ncbi:MAG: hypothetical protein QNL68_11870 [Akkermansiaceae bacterium]|jgi:hypothetical protein
MKLGLALMIIVALNEQASWSLTPFSDQEILSTILGIDPGVDDDYLAWIAAFSVANTSLVADPDGDDLDNLGEFALNLNHSITDAPAPDVRRNFNFTLEASRVNDVKTDLTVSSDLENWTPLPAQQPLVLPEPFVRLEFSLLDNQ